MSRPSKSASEDARAWEWWAAEGEHPESYQIAEPDRDTVIAVARCEFGADAVITIVEATQDGPFDADIFDDDAIREAIFDSFCELNGHRWGEDGWEGFGCDAAADRQLADMLRDAFSTWLDEHGRAIPTFTFTAQRNKETIRPDDADTTGTLL